ncbi:hypothetical protein G6675_03550 [Polynucleobacter paneuropaeus]|nr:hypothetical protein [Polynucleobacter paneuropaeus]MBT8600022.1 hypothetical protein [Polynucleobacter paneuropaeus]
MSFSVLNVPVDAKVVEDFISIFRFKTDFRTYQNSTLQKMKEQWGEDLSEEQSGYIDATLNIVEDGKLKFPFKQLSTDELEAYITEKIGDFSLYARLWHSTPSEYEIEVPYNIGTVDDEYWVDMSLSFDGNFNVTKVTFSYDTDIPSNKYLTYWIMKCSN